MRMHFSYDSEFGAYTPEAYERLLLEAVSGDATLFIRRDEVETAWGIVDPIRQAWVGVPLAEREFYTAGSWGPAAADDLLAQLRASLDQTASGHLTCAYGGLPDEIATHDHDKPPLEVLKRQNGSPSHAGLRGNRGIGGRGRPKMAGQPPGCPRARTRPTAAAICLADEPSARFSAAFVPLVRREPDAVRSAHFFWADERCVPPTSADSNFAGAKQLLLDPLGLDPVLIHRIEGELPP